METQKEKKIVLGVIIVGLLFGAGMLVRTMLKSEPATPAKQNDTFQAGWDAAKKQLAENGIGGIPAGVEIKSVTGTAQKISADSIDVKIVSAADPLADPSFNIRTVKISKDTKIYQLAMKDQKQFSQEMEEFQKKSLEQIKDQKAETISPPVNPPSAYDKKEITLSEIKEGQVITATANENIREKKEFTATEISAQVMPSAPVMDNPPIPSGAASPAAGESSSGSLPILSAPIKEDSNSASAPLPSPLSAASQETSAPALPLPRP